MNHNYWQVISNVSLINQRDVSICNLSRFLRIFAARDIAELFNVILGVGGERKIWGNGKCETCVKLNSGNFIYRYENGQKNEQTKTCVVVKKYENRSKD